MAPRALPLAPRVHVDELNFDRVTMKDAVRRIAQMARRHDRPRYVCTGNLDHLVIADRDPEFRAAYLDADLVVADGAPVVWLSRLGGEAPLPERVAGSDLVWEVARISSERGLKVFLLGGVEGAAEKAAEAFLQRYPSAKICGTYCPPFATFDTEEEQRNIRQAVRRAAPDILLVAFGAPKQEKWIAKNKDLLGVPVSIGVGGSFEMVAQIVKRAPVWLQKSGLEWLYRFTQEPKRLFQRYFVDDLPYLAGAMTRTLGARARRSLLAN